MHKYRKIRYQKALRALIEASIRVKDVYDDQAIENENTSELAQKTRKYKNCVKRELKLDHINQLLIEARTELESIMFEKKKRGR